MTSRLLVRVRNNWLKRTGHTATERRAESLEIDAPRLERVENVLRVVDGLVILVRLAAMHMAKISENAVDFVKLEGCTYGTARCEPVRQSY